MKERCLVIVRKPYMRLFFPPESLTPSTLPRKKRHSVKVHDAGVGKVANYPHFVVNIVATGLTLTSLESNHGFRFPGAFNFSVYLIEWILNRVLLVRGFPAQLDFLRQVC